ncbi:dnaJ [Perkinsela sp. CCAP 1560/4]|nr:dnaJ [Perkinsela sp. CCAP 1560/4]|eukprot:KNH07852.1 dnaJ [Perkinsela sp. CCAP 1560/4]
MDDIDDFDDVCLDSSKGNTSFCEQVKISDSEVVIKPFRHKCATGRFTYLTEDEKKTDCYGLLKVPRNATSSAIKEAYHQQCLQTHPDKQREENDDEGFKKVVKAFQILGDPLKRRVYDSIGPIDELVVRDKEYTDEEFFEVFEKHFQKISKWCHVQPPSLGNISTDMDLVDEFYDFWFDFKSWRDFSFHSEEEVPAEISREEKRYIYHDCERKISRLQKNESKAVRALVDKCRKSDPRIKRRTEQKQAERNERILAKKMASVNLNNRNQTIPCKSAKPDLAKKKASADIENCIKQLQKLGVIAKNSDKAKEINVHYVTLYNLRRLLQTTEHVSEVNSLVASLRSNQKKLIESLNTKIKAIEDRLNADKKAPESMPCAEVSQPSHPTTWGDADIIELQKAIIMFPRGTVDRWAKISTFLKEKYSAAEVLAKTKEMESQWQVAKDHSQKNPKLDAAAKSSTEEDHESTSSSTSAWSLKQQKQFEEGLRKYQTYKEQDKWIKVSETVDGKSESECIERYKTLCNMVKR